MKEKDLHTKQRDEMRKQNASSERNRDVKNTSGQTTDNRDGGRRDVANEDRPRETSIGRP